jgi:hypothetical protein
VLPPSILKIVDQLRSDLDEIASAMRFVATASSLRARLAAMLNWAAMDSSAKALAQTFMGLREADRDTVFRGLYVTVAASYEDFIRQLVAAGVELAASRAATFDALPEGLKHHNIYSTGRAFENVFGRRTHLKLDFYQLSADIGSCVPGSGKFRLNSEAFSIDVTTPSADGLDRALERIGVRNYWDELARNKGVQRSLKAGGVREASKLARDYLNTFIERRNTIVHAGHGAITIVEADVAEALDFFATFGEALGEVVSNRV